MHQRQTRFPTIWSSYGADSKSFELRDRDVRDSQRRCGPRLQRWPSAMG